MITLREAATGLLNAVESAIESGDWKVHGACDPSVEIIRLKNALGKPNEQWVGLTAPEVQECYDLNPARFAKAIEAKLKEKNA